MIRKSRLQKDWQEPLNGIDGDPISRCSRQPEINLESRNEIMNKPMNPIHAAFCDQELADATLSFAASVDLLGSPVVVHALAGNDSDAAWEARYQCTRDLAGRAALARSLAGLQNERADSLREELLRSGLDPSELLRGLAGTSAPRWYSYRVECLERGRGLPALGKSLIGVDTEWSWELRAELLARGADVHGVIMSAAGIESRRANDLRVSFAQQGYELEAVALSTSGTFSDIQFQLRGRLSAVSGVAEYVAHSLVFDNSVDAWVLRQKLCDSGVSMHWIALGLAGLIDQRSMEFRNELRERGCPADSLLLGINGDYLSGGLRSSLPRVQLTETTPAIKYQNRI